MELSSRGHLHQVYEPDTELWKPTSGLCLHQPYKLSGKVSAKEFDLAARSLDGEPLHAYDQPLTNLGICPLIANTVFPLGNWILLLGLQRNSRRAHLSRLAQNLLRRLQFLETVLERLQQHHIYTLFAIFTGLTMSTALMIYLFARFRPTRRGSTFLSCFFTLLIGSPLWVYEGGDAVEFTLVFLPLALSLGIVLGLFVYVNLSPSSSSKPYTRHWRLH